MPKRELKIPEATEEWVLDRFGDVADSRTEAYRMALAFAMREDEIERARVGLDDGQSRREG